MKQSILLLFVLLIIPNMLVAQSGTFMERPPAERAEIQTKLMAYELSLSDSSRIDKVHKINLKYAKKMEELATSGGSRRAKFRKMRSLSEDKDKELKKALTSEQYEEYLELKEEWRNRIIEEMQKRRQDEVGNLELPENNDIELSVKGL